jgi:hypothetical protein
LAMFEIAALQPFCLLRNEIPLQQSVTMTLDPSHLNLETF